VSVVAFEVVCRAWDCFVTEMDGEPVEVLHDLLDVRLEFVRQVLDLIEHRLEPTETYLVGWCGEDALEFTQTIGRVVKPSRLCSSGSVCESS